MLDNAMEKTGKLVLYLQKDCETIKKKTLSRTKEPQRALSVIFDKILSLGKLSPSDIKSE